MLEHILPGLTGYRCVQVGTWGQDGVGLDKAGTLCHWRLGFGARSRADIGFDGRHLPLATASVDALVVAHALERVAQPHALLRECARVLSARGQIVVLAFNPLALWTVRQNLLSRRQPAFRACSVPPSASRLCDWLRLLDFDPEQIWRYGLGFPFFGGHHNVGQGSRWRRCAAWTAQSYAIVARRHVSPRTLIPGALRKRAPRPAMGLARYSSRPVSWRG